MLIPTHLQVLCTSKYLLALHALNAESDVSSCIEVCGGGTQVHVGRLDEHICLPKLLEKNLW